MEFKSLSVVVPAYNEEKRIESTLQQLVSHLQNHFPAFEIIVVDDGSTDATAEKVRQAATANHRIVLHRLPENRGKGFAVRAGMLLASGDAVLFTDADLSTPVEEIDMALAELRQGFPVVIASRRHPQSVIARRQSWPRELLGRAFNKVIRLVLSLPFKDTQCGFKCFTGAAAKAIFARATIDTFSFDVEVLMIAMALGFSIKEIPVRWTDAPGSKVRPWRDAAIIFYELIIVRRNSSRYQALASRDSAHE